jgi:hypothetical protein
LDALTLTAMVCRDTSSPTIAYTSFALWPP